MASITGIEKVFSLMQPTFSKSYATGSYCGKTVASNIWACPSCDRFVEDALVAARKGDFSLSSELLHKAGRLGLSQAIGSQSWANFVSHFASVASYLFYRRGDRARAISTLEEANLADLLLIIIYGNIPAHLHRITLAHNRAKVEWKFGNYDDARRIVTDLIGHLSGEKIITIQPLRGSWDNRLCLVCPNKTRGYLIQNFKIELENWESSNSHAKDNEKQVDLHYDNSHVES